MTSGSTNNEEFKKLIIHHTQNHNVDTTIITAASKSSSLVNLAMEITREKGTVVIVGDIGLNVNRKDFYKKEINLLMSRSYGPGRHDQQYEELLALANTLQESGSAPIPFEQLIETSAVALHIEDLIHGK